MRPGGAFYLIVSWGRTAQPPALLFRSLSTGFAGSFFTGTNFAGSTVFAALSLPSMPLTQ